MFKQLQPKALEHSEKQEAKRLRLARELGIETAQIGEPNDDEVDASFLALQLFAAAPKRLNPWLGVGLWLGSLGATAFVLRTLALPQTTEVVTAESLAAVAIAACALVVWLVTGRR
jgi:hypothetical protein